MDERCCVGVCDGGAGAGAGSDSRVTHLRPAKATLKGCLQVFCRGVRFTFHLVGDSQSLTLTRISEYFVL